MDRKQKFLRVYSNLPLGLRKEIILVLEGKGPITWEVAYLEVENDTPLAGIILEKLENLGFI